MATTGRPDEPATPASDVAASCRDAGLVHLVGARSGVALAAVGLLGRGLAAAGRPFQARLVGAETTADPGATDADCTIGVCRPDLAADHVVGPTASAQTADRAYAIGTALAGEDGLDPALGLAAAAAAGTEPGSRLREDATAAGIDRRPGVAVPTTDLADGIAHSTLVHAPFSGDRSAAADALADLDVGDEPDEADRRRVASLVALAVAETEGCPPQATRALGRVLHPYAGGPLETIGGYADVLDALARTDPGLGIAVALDRTPTADGLDAWREHASRVHGAAAAVDLVRHDGLAVARAEMIDDVARLGPVGRLVRDFRSPEPTVLCRGAGALVVTTVAEGVDAAALLADACEAAGVETPAGVHGDATAATVATDDHDPLVEEVRRGLR